MIVAGIDEAGYGPMLGPLVVSVALFRVPDAKTDATPDLWKELSPAVSRKPQDRRMPINDSKKLFKQKKSLVHLEEGLLPFLLVRHGKVPASLRALLRIVARRGSTGAADYLDAYPWYTERDVELPRDTFGGMIRKLASTLAKSQEASGVEFLGIAAAPVEVAEFNQQLHRMGNKSAVSFESVAGFLRRLWKQFSNEDVLCVIDRQGGRVSYGKQLFDAVKPRGVQIEVQTPECSRYQLTRRNGNQSAFTVEFSTESEEKHMAVALASMLSKYLRELHMLAFNEYFVEHAKDLKPTAGYVQDARRFLKDTLRLRRTLGVDDALLIRKR